MAICKRSVNWANARITAFVLAIAVLLSGCGQQKPSPEQLETVVGGAQAQAGASSVTADPHMHQPFAEATISEPPEDWLRPPDTTISGKSVG
jgi:hypothetical protein